MVFVQIKLKYSTSLKYHNSKLVKSTFMSFIYIDGGIQNRVFNKKRYCYQIINWIMIHIPGFEPKHKCVKASDTTRLSKLMKTE